MDTVAARALLEDMLQWQAAPALTVAEVDRLMLSARIVDAAGYAFRDTWLALTSYQAGAIRVPLVGNGYQYVVTVAGTSGAAAPVWPAAAGATVVDGSVTWAQNGAYLWTPAYDLRRAARRGWLQKAAKVAALFDASPGGGVQARRSQMYQHCMEMAQSFGGGIGTIQVIR